MNLISGVVSGSGSSCGVAGRELASLAGSILGSSQSPRWASVHLPRPLLSFDFVVPTLTDESGTAHWRILQPPVKSVAPTSPEVGDQIYQSETNPPDPSHPSRPYPSSNLSPPLKPRRQWVDEPGPRPPRPLRRRPTRPRARPRARRRPGASVPACASLRARSAACGDFRPSTRRRGAGIRRGCGRRRGCRRAGGWW